MDVFLYVCVYLRICMSLSVRRTRGSKKLVIVCLCVCLSACLPVGGALLGSGLELSKFRLLAHGAAAAGDGIREISSTHQLDFSGGLV